MKELYGRQKKARRERTPLFKIPGRSSFADTGRFNLYRLQRRKCIFGAACCAERVAVFKAISDGRRDFTAILLCLDSQDLPFRAEYAGK